jgi:hypothetical protein
MANEQRINDIPSNEEHTPTIFQESDQDDIQPKTRKRTSSSKQPKPSRTRSHSSPSLEEPITQTQTLTHETPTKAKTRAARRAIDTFEEETPVPQAPRKERRTARYVRIDDIRMNLARKFKEDI